MIALLLACSNEPISETTSIEQTKTPNVVFITMDTTRRDRNSEPMDTNLQEQVESIRLPIKVIDSNTLIHLFR